MFINPLKEVEYGRGVRKDKISVTNATAKAIATDEGTKIEYSPKAIKISKAIEGKFGCQTRDVFNLVSAIVDFPLKPVSSEKLPALGAMIICIGRNHNGHDYGDKPFIVTTERQGMRKKEGMGNTFPITAGSWRYATKKEIDWYYAK